jgi:hypothetical protein
VLGTDQIEQERRGSGIGDDGAPHRDLFAGRDAHGACSPFANDNTRDARIQPQPPAVSLEQGYERVRDGLRPSARHGVPARRRRHSEHPAEAGSEAVVGPDIHVQRKARQNASRGFAAEQAARERAPARAEHAQQTKCVDQAEVQERSQRGKRQQQRAQQLVLDGRVPARDATPHLSVAGVTEVCGSEIVIARDAGVAAVGRGMAALEACVLPLHRRVETELRECRAGSAEREEARSDVVSEPGQRRFFGPQRSAGTPRIGFEHEHLKASPREQDGRDQAVRSGTDDDDVGIACHASRM